MTTTRAAPVIQVVVGGTNERIFVSPIQFRRACELNSDLFGK